MKIRMTASMKTEVTSGRGQLWMRIDRASKKPGFFDNMDNRPVSKKDWARYEIVGQVDADANSIVFGAFLSGAGKVWLDNFIIEVQDKGIWVKVPVKNASFEESVGKEVKDWYANSPGYQYEVVSESAVDGQHAVQIKDGFEVKVSPKIFEIKPRFGDHFTKNIGNKISCLVPLVLMGTEKETYPAADPAKLNKLIKDLETAVPGNMNDTDPYVRLTGIVMSWNVFQHFYPYQDDVKTDWENQLPIALKEAYLAKTGQEYQVLLNHFTEKLKDGHVAVSGPNIHANFTIPVELALVEGKVIIKKVDDIADGAQLPLKPGDVITHIDNVPVLERLALLEKEISGSEQWKNVRATQDILKGAKDTELTLRITRGDDEQLLKLVRKSYHTSKDTVTIKKMDNDIYFINISNAKMEQIKAMLPELKKAKGIICDLRGYPTNNSEFITNLLTVKDTNKWMFVPQISYPDYEKVSYDGLGWDLTPSPEHISAKVVFLTGGGAISYAESYMGFIKQYKLATIVGQPTAGANGNVNMFTLPGNYTIRFTGMRVKQQDGSLLQGVGIQPDILVNETIQGITEGRDEYLEKALSLFN